MRREQNFDDAGIILVSVALVLMIAVVVAIAERNGGQQDDGFITAEPSSSGFISPLVSPGDQIRVNELPQIR